MFTNDLKTPNSFGIPITRAIGLSLSKSGWQSTGSSRWAGKGHSTRFTARRRIAERQKGIIFSKTISPPPPPPYVKPESRPFGPALASDSAIARAHTTHSGAEDVHEAIFLSLGVGFHVEIKKCIPAAHYQMPVTRRAKSDYKPEIGHGWKSCSQHRCLVAT